ncbi:hypothetical protein [Nonomuraea africana]|uniref:hypothetical protein n=1 Tax=Nonomuraea africana TaxID=46171 RepID=UPI0033FFD549
MTGIRGWFRQLCRHDDAPDASIVDSLHRLVDEAVHGRRHAFDDLVRALFRVVTDAVLAERALNVLAMAGPKVWIDLDPSVRTWMDGSRLTKASAVHQMSNPLAVALAACARDGRARRRAVGHPAMRTDVRLFPVLAIRTTDWAEPVRERALNVLGEVLARADAATLVAVVPVSVRLGGRGRGGRIMEMVRDALRRADDETLRLVRGCADLRGRRLAFDVALEAGRMDRRQLTAAALRESDIISRTRCAQLLAAQAIARDQPDLVAELLAATSARVRVEALTALVRLGRTEHGAGFLGDDAAMVRLTAQWAVRRGGGDPAELYRRRLAGSGSRGLLAGLGDCGTSADAGLVVPYLRDARPRVRAEAVRTLRRLDAEVDVAALLEDPAPMVVRNVVDTLRASGGGVPVERLWALLGAGRPRHVRRAAHRLLARRDAWARIKADLLLAGDPDELLSGHARADLDNWCRRDLAHTYHRCPAELRRELEDLLTGVEAAVGSENARLLHWLLRTG